MNDTPTTLHQVIKSFETYSGDWDSERWMGIEFLEGRPLLPLVHSFLADPTTGHHRLGRLCLAAARRALPTWALYCDDDQPARTIEAVARFLVDGVVSAEDQQLTTPAKPSFQGIEILDCRQCDTSSAATSAARALAFCLHGDPLDAMECLSDARGALDQSPLGAKENFRQWFVEVAVPRAWKGEDIDDASLNRFRDYSPLEIQPAS